MGQAGLLVLYPGVVATILSWVERTHRAGPTWGWAGAIAMTSSIGFLVYMSPFRETSPVSSIFWGAGPALIAALILRLSERLDLEWYWKAAWTTVVLGVLMIPLFFASCIVADWFPGVPGCFF